MTFTSKTSITLLIIIFGGICGAYGHEEYRYQSRHICSSEEAAEHPHLCHLMNMAAGDPETLSSELHIFAQNLGMIIDPQVKESKRFDVRAILGQAHGSSVVRMRHLRGDTEEGDGASLPTVLAHGMGDSCFNDGMKRITKRVADSTKQYATCVPTGDNLHDDIINGYFMSMDANIDAFAQRVRADSNLSDGFSAIGFFQGNNVIRGYIARYNDPPVHTFISINGVNAGIGAVPFCIPKLGQYKPRELSMINSDKRLYAKTVGLQGRICDALMEVASNRAYSEFSQTHSFQANYWRDPRPEEAEEYHKYSQLARLGNEGTAKDPTLNENYAKTEQFVWILATKDTIVWPREGEHWGAPDPSDPFNKILDMIDTDWYKADSFGLQTAEIARKNHFEQFEGDHLQFQMEEFDVWIEKYIVK